VLVGEQSLYCLNRPSCRSIFSTQTHRSTFVELSKYRRGTPIHVRSIPPLNNNLKIRGNNPDRNK
jgi:hypothetical protein